MAFFTLIRVGTEVGSDRSVFSKTSALGSKTVLPPSDCVNLSKKFILVIPGETAAGGTGGGIL